MKYTVFLSALLTVAVLINSILPDTHAQSSTNDDVPLPEMQRCINMGNALEAPNYEGEWGVYIQDSYMQTIAEAGFDTVRIPIRWSANAEPQPPYTIEEEFFERVDEVIQLALDAELNVIINIHHFNEMNNNPDAELPRLFALWEQIGTRYADYPMELMFELFNEPNGTLNADRWNQIQPTLVEYVRTFAPDRGLIIGGADWNSMFAMETMVLPQDTYNIIATFHNYEPFEFTHQGAEWVDGSDAWLGQTWGSNNDYATLEDYFARGVAFMEAHNLPVLMGEFGVYSTVDMENRAEWTAAVVELAELNDMSWCYWEFASGFGAYDGVLRRWREPLLEALIVDSPALAEE